MTGFCDLVPDVLWLIARELEPRNLRKMYGLNRWLRQVMTYRMPIRHLQMVLARPDPYKEACYRNHLSILQYLIYQRTPGLSLDYCLRTAIRRGHFPMIQWLASLYSPTQLSQVVNDYLLQVFPDLCMSSSLQLILWVLAVTNSLVLLKSDIVVSSVIRAANSQRLEICQLLWPHLSSDQQCQAIAQSSHRAGSVYSYLSSQ